MHINLALRSQVTQVPEFESYTFIVWCLREVVEQRPIKEGARQIGFPSESLERQRRRRRGTTFSSSKQRRQRELQRKQAQDSRTERGETSWRQSCSIRTLVLEPILEEAEAGNYERKSRVLDSTMEGFESEQPSLTVQSELEKQELGEETTDDSDGTISLTLSTYPYSILLVKLVMK